MQLDRILLLVVVSLGFLSTEGAEAQDPQPAVSPAELAVGLRTQVDEHRHLRGVLVSLVQLRGSHPSEELDALADSLVAVAIDYSKRDGDDGIWIRRTVSAILIEAAHWQDPRGGRPYERAVECLVVLAYDMAGGAGILAYLAQLPDRAKGLNYLREIAVSDHRRAGSAVTALVWYGGTDGEELLRELYDEDLVQEPHAKRELQVVAWGRGWE